MNFDVNNDIATLHDDSVPVHKNITLTFNDVSGLTEAQAREALAGFTIIIARAPDPRVPEGRVALQNPIAGTKAEPNQNH